MPGKLDGLCAGEVYEESFIFIGFAERPKMTENAVFMENCGDQQCSLSAFCRRGQQAHHE